MRTVLSRLCTLIRSEPALPIFSRYPHTGPRRTLTAAAVNLFYARRDQRRARDGDKKGRPVAAVTSLPMRHRSRGRGVIRGGLRGWRPPEQRGQPSALVPPPRPEQIERQLAFPADATAKRPAPPGPVQTISGSGLNAQSGARGARPSLTASLEGSAHHPLPREPACQLACTSVSIISAQQHTLVRCRNGIYDDSGR